MAQPQTQTDTDSMGAPHAEVAVIYFWHTKCPRCPLEKGQNGRYFGQIHPTLVSCESSQYCLLQMETQSIKEGATRHMHCLVWHFVTAGAD